MNEILKKESEQKYVEEAAKLLNILGVPVDIERDAEHRNAVASLLKLVASYAFEIEMPDSCFGPYTAEKIPIVSVGLIPSSIDNTVQSTCSCVSEGSDLLVIDGSREL